MQCSCQCCKRLADVVGRCQQLNRTSYFCFEIVFSQLWLTYLWNTINQKNKNTVYVFTFTTIQLQVYQKHLYTCAFRQTLKGIVWLVLPVRHSCGSWLVCCGARSCKADFDACPRPKRFPWRAVCHQGWFVGHIGEAYSIGVADCTWQIHLRRWPDGDGMVPDQGGMETKWSKLSLMTWEGLVYEINTYVSLFWIFIFVVVTEFMFTFFLHTLWSTW